MVSSTHFKPSRESETYLPSIPTTFDTILTIVEFFSLTKSLTKDGVASNLCDSGKNYNKISSRLGTGSTDRFSCHVMPDYVICGKLFFCAWTVFNSASFLQLLLMIRLSG